MTTDYSRYRHLSIQLDNGIATLTLNQPENRNAIHAEMHAELEHVFLDLQSDRQVNVIVLTGAGRMFSAGGDIKRMVNRYGTDEGWQFAIDTPASTKRLFQNILEVEKPIIAAINGDAVGLGATLALFADSTVIAETAKFGDSHVKVGLVAGDGGAVIWPLVLGPARAKRYLLTGDAVTAEEAERIGLVTHVVTADRLQEEALAFATRLAEGAPLAIRHTKIAVNKLVKDALNIAFDYSTAAETLTMASEDHREAVRAIREKRKPVFKGR
jgi:enoyl-CoA hydratase